MITYFDQIQKNISKDLLRCNNSDRMTTQKIFQSMVRSYTNELGLASSVDSTVIAKDYISKLNKDGYFVLHNFLNELEIQSIREYYDEKLGYESHIPSFTNTPPKKFSGDLNCSMFSYTPDISLQSELIFKKLLMNQIFIELSERYLNCLPTLYSINCYHTIANKNYDTHNIHRDYDDFKFLAFFVYLTDVGPNDGGFSYYPYTHQRDRKRIFDKNKLIQGKSGTLIVADTYGLHHGSIPKINNRFAIWWRYGLCLNHGYWVDSNYRWMVDKGEFQSLTKEQQYILRGFLK